MKYSRPIPAQQVADLRGLVGDLSIAELRDAIAAHGTTFGITTIQRYVAGTRAANDARFLAGLAAYKGMTVDAVMERLGFRSAGPAGQMVDAESAWAASEPGEMVKPRRLLEGAVWHLSDEKAKVVWRAVISGSFARWVEEEARRQHGAVAPQDAPPNTPQPVHPSGGGVRTEDRR